MTPVRRRPSFFSSGQVMQAHHDLFFSIFSFLFGAAVGSFLNVVIVRLPQQESLVSPPSRCPKCGRSIRFYDNIPILSWLMLGGRCRDCDQRIPVRYPLVELSTALMFTGLFLVWGLQPATLVYFCFCAAMIAVFWIDLKHMIIPDAISLNLIPVGMACSVAGLLPDMNWKQSLFGFVLGGLVLYVPAAIYEKLRGIEGLGGGDVKLLAMIGAFTGPVGVLFVLFVSSTVGSLFGLVGMASAGAGSTTPIPFGPFITSAAVLYVFAGTRILAAFFGFSFPV